jgi:hypothetical protein
LLELSQPFERTNPDSGSYGVFFFVTTHVVARSNVISDSP